MISQPIDIIICRLALAFGKPDTDEFMSSITAGQFAKWLAYYSLEPWGYGPDNLRAATIAKAVADYSPIAKRHNHKKSEFMPPPPTPPPSVAVQIAQLFGVPFGKKD